MVDQSNHKLSDNSWILIVAIIISASMLQIDWATILSWRIFNSQRILKQDLIDKNLQQESIFLKNDNPSRELLVHQYHTAVKEIQMRLDQESQLFAFKFSLVGAILALLFGSYLKSSKQKECLSEFVGFPFIASFFWAAVITSAIIDSRILFHAVFIGTLGEWINFKVEPFLLQKGIIGWETYLRQTGLTCRNNIYPLLRLNANLLTLVLFSITVFLFFSPKTILSRSLKGFPDTITISLAGGIISFVVFFCVGIHFHYDCLGWILWSFFWMSIGIIFSYLLWRSYKKSQR